MGEESRPRLKGRRGGHLSVMRKSSLPFLTFSLTPRSQLAALSLDVKLRESRYVEPFDQPFVKWRVNLISTG
jgi:hypothetical protein